MSQAAAMTFRPGTLDETIFNCINLYNEYRLPDTFAPDDVLIDIGMHIGSFSYAALTRGAGRVYGFEAEPSNFACAARNLSAFGDRARIAHKAVWRSDRKVKTLNIGHSNDTENTGGGNVFWSKGGHDVAAIAFDDVVRDATEKGRRRIRLLKIDCETAEFPILLTSRTLHRIDQIAGEYHECQGAYDKNPIPDHARIAGVDRFTIQVLADHLRREGFEVTHERLRVNDQDTNIGTFFATRTAEPKRPRLSVFWPLRR